MEESASFTLHLREFYVKTFLRNRNEHIGNIEALTSKSNQHFFALDEMSQEELISYLEEDSFYIEGAICIWSFGREVLLFVHWDLVDQLWSYFAQAFEKLILEGKESAFFMFPDQPLKIEIFKSKGKFKLVVGGSNDFLLSERSISYFLSEGKRFFEILGGVPGFSNEIFEINRIKKIIEKIQSS